MAKKNDTTVSEFWSHLGWDDLAGIFGNTTITRGCSYAHSGHVNQIWVSSDRKNIVAQVRGTDDYWVAVTISPKKRSGQLEIASTRCFCPVGSSCKHAVAAIAVYLDKYLAKDTTPPVCEKLGNDQWKLEKTNGNPTTITISDWEDDDEEDWDDWDDEDDDWDDEDDDEDNDDDEDAPPIKNKTTKAKAKKSPPAKKTDTAPKDVIHDLLQQNTKDELVSTILQLYNNHPDVKKQFDREIKQNEKLGDDDKLRKEIKKLIKDTFRSSEYSGRYGSRRHRYDDPEECPDFSDIHDFIGGLKKHPDPFELFRYLSLELIPAIDAWHHDHFIDEGWDFEYLFICVAEAALAEANRDDIAKYYQWGDELNAREQEYEYASSVGETIEEFSWSKKGLNQFADTLRDGFSKKENCNNYSYIRRFTNIMVQSGRRAELIELLRPHSKQQGVSEIFVKQLVEEKMYDEAIERMLSEYLSETKGYSYWGWFKQLTELARQRKNWSLFASVYANELFHKPALDMITGLLEAAKKLDVESVVLTVVTKYLEEGMVPEAVVQTLEKKKTSASATKNWPLAVLQGDVRKLDIKPHIELLCEWAISENRPKDAVLWYKKCSPSARERNSIPLANIIWEVDPNLAIDVYQKAAMKIVDATNRNEYSTAAAYLGKIEKIYAQTGRAAEGAAFMEKVRSENKRKPAFIKELDAMRKRLTAVGTK